MLDKFISSASKKIAFNTLAQTTGKLATLVINLLATALVTRGLGRAGYGDYSLARNFWLFFTLWVDFGLNAVVVRAVTRKKSLTSHYFRNLISLRLLVTIVFVLLGLGIAFLAPYPAVVKRGIAIALLILFPWSLYTSANTIFQVNFRYDRSVVSLILGQLVKLALIFVGIKEGWGLLYLIGAGLVGNAVTVFFISFLIKGLGVSFTLGSDLRCWRTLVRTAFPIGLALIFAQINAKTDLFLLSLLPIPGRFGLGSRETLGVYSLAYQLFKNAIVLPTFFMNAFFPIMVVDHKEDRARFMRRLRKVVLLLLVISVLGVGVGIVLAPWVIRLIAGEGFEHSIIALRILLLGLPLFFLSSPLQWVLVTVGKERALPFIYGLAAALNVALNLIFIPRFSYQASAAIVGVVEAVILSGLVYSVWRHLRGREYAVKNVVPLNQ